MISSRNPTVNILPRLLKIFGHDIPQWCEGKPLPKIGGVEGEPDRSIYSMDAKRNSAHEPLKIGMLALIRGRHKLIHYSGYAKEEDSFELYDLEKYPEELEDLYSTRTQLSNSLRGEMLDTLHAVNHPFE